MTRGQVHNTYSVSVTQSNSFFSPLTEEFKTRQNNYVA